MNNARCFAFTKLVSCRLTCCVFFVMGLVPYALLAQPTTYTNPILNGGYPDPSICFDGDYFVLVNSTFEYFPGLPIHRSKDLVNWELVGHGLHRKSQVTGQVNLLDVQSDGGIHAPSIRCHNGKYYIITTNVYSPAEAGADTQFVNFVLTADNIEGPWSEPLVLDGAPGIDPDIIFDDDGKVWYVGTHSPEKPNFPGEGEIWLQQIDTQRWRLTGERHFLWRGACGGVWAEGPHIYKRKGFYYLMIAEGGTSFNHAVTIAVSDSITGPYQANPRNPILSTRHLSYDYWVNSVGHADLIQLPDDRWYMVALGIRGDLKRRSNMGRETHLIPVVWEQEPFWWQEVKYEWPVVAPLTGRVERQWPLPFEGRQQYRNLSFNDDFDSTSLGLAWNFRRYPVSNSYSLHARRGYLRLYAMPGVIAERGRASLLGIRQTESDFIYQVHMDFSPQQNDIEAGVNLFQKDNNYLSFVVSKSAGTIVLKSVVSLPENDVKKTKSVTTLETRVLDSYRGSITFKVVSENNTYKLLYSLNHGESFELLLTTSADHILSKSYTGAYLGLYASSNGQKSKGYADFDNVSYQAFER